MDILARSKTDDEVYAPQKKYKTIQYNAMQYDTIKQSGIPHASCNYLTYYLDSTISLTINAYLGLLPVTIITNIAKSLISNNVHSGHINDFIILLRQCRKEL